MAKLCPITQNFDLYEIIGRTKYSKIDGTTCTVRRVISKNTGQTFAIKVYQNQLLKAKNQIDMLMRLDHPSIVNIYDIYQDENMNTITLVLEYMCGGELYNTVCNKTKFSQTQVRQINFLYISRQYMKALVDAVRYCHQLGIVHRDIKPENLLLTTTGPDAILKLADFGISKIISGEMLNTMIGTPVYMAPEVWDETGYNEKVDVWSIGVVMYYLLTGYHPFVGDDNQQKPQKYKQKQLRFPEQMLKSVSSKAINLLRLILNKNPDQRPSAKDVANHLWLNHIDTIPKEIELAQQVNLHKTVHKIRRFIFKQRLRKNNQMINQLTANAKKNKVSKTRFDFLMAQAQVTQMSYTKQQSAMEEQGQVTNKY